KAEPSVLIRRNDDFRSVGRSRYEHAPRCWTSPRAFDGRVGAPIAPMGRSESFRDTSITRVSFTHDANRHLLDRKWLAGVIGERAREDQITHARRWSLLTRRACSQLRGPAYADPHGGRLRRGLDGKKSDHDEKHHAKPPFPTT